jgi:hypothetical protein
MLREYCIGLQLKELMDTGKKYKRMMGLKYYIIVLVLSHGKAHQKET